MVERKRNARRVGVHRPAARARAGALQRHLGGPVDARRGAARRARAVRPRRGRDEARGAGDAPRRLARRVARAAARPAALARGRGADDDADHPAARGRRHGARAVGARLHARGAQGPAARDPHDALRRRLHLLPGDDHGPGHDRADQHDLAGDPARDDDVAGRHRLPDRLRDAVRRSPTSRSSRSRRWTHDLSPLLAGFLATMCVAVGLSASRCCSTAGRSSASRGRAREAGAAALDRRPARRVADRAARPADAPTVRSSPARGDRPPARPRRAPGGLTVQRYIGLQVLAPAARLPRLAAADRRRRPRR